jgi:hypothetical protein
VQLTFDTSFTGKDLLRTNLRAGNFGNSVFGGEPHSLVLAELEAANAGADPKAKGKAPPAKGKGAGGPSGEEQLRADLELATKVQPEGWILIDFPRSLEQAKTMERLMNNGFTCMIDRPKDQVQKEFEAWSKFVSPASSIA